MSEQRLIDVYAPKEKEQYIPCRNGLLFHGVTAATIDSMPVVDARPVVHALWVESKRAHYFKCSSCKKPVPYRKAVQINGTRKYNFYPYCGAQMDGGTDNG